MIEFTGLFFIFVYNLNDFEKKPIFLAVSGGLHFVAPAILHDSNTYIIDLFLIRICEKNIFEFQMILFRVLRVHAWIDIN